MTDVLEKAAKAHLAVEQVEQLRTRLLAERRELIKAARDEGHTYREIASVIGLSSARVQRAVAGNRPQHPRKRPDWPSSVEL